MKKLGIYWFNNDLRLDDNPALLAAAREVNQLLCIAFVPQNQLSQFHPIPIHLSEHRLNFLLQSLSDLDQNLRRLGQHLIVSSERPESVLLKLIQQYGITHLYVCDDGNPARETVIQSLHQQVAQLNVRTVSDNRLYSQQTLPFAITELPNTFSKFRRKVEKLKTKLAVPPPEMLPPAVTSTLEWRHEFKRCLLPETSEFYGGESAGLKHLVNYFQGNHPSTYKLTRNALDGFYQSTKFSPWLANGCLSVRRVLEHLHQYEDNVVNNESTYWIFFELLWREYFQWYVKCHKQRVFAFTGVNGNKPATSFYPERFRKWCHGNTPFAIVNACMKQLNATGYMSNRGRQLVASCLVNELALDWRYGAAYMEQQLIDYDLGSNWGNWQYLAGVGADPRGLRHFDLDKQTQRYDPDYQFINRWQSVPVQNQLDSTDAADWPIQQRPLAGTGQ